MNQPIHLAGVLIAILIPALFVLVVFRVMRRSAAQRRLRVSEPACPACHYPVRGLNTMLCPECGADFREVGILTPSMHPERRSGLLSLICTWTVAVVIIAMIATPLLAMVPGVHRREMDVSMLLQSRAAPFAPIELNFYATGQSYADAADRLKLTLGAGRSELEAVRRHDGWRITRSPDPSHHGTNLERSTLVSIMSAARWRADDPGTLAEADDFLLLMDAAHASLDAATMTPVRSLRSAGSGKTSYTGAAPWFTPAILTLWGMLWAAGVYLLIKSRRPMSAASAAAPAAA